MRLLKHKDNSANESIFKENGVVIKDEIVNLVRIKDDIENIFHVLGGFLEDMGEVLKEEWIVSKCLDNDKWNKMFNTSSSII